MGISFTVGVMFHFDKPQKKTHHYVSSAESTVLKGKAIDSELGLQI